MTKNNFLKIKSPKSLPSVPLALIKTHLNPMWKLYSNFNIDEIECQKGALDNKIDMPNSITYLN